MLSSNIFEVADRFKRLLITREQVTIREIRNYYREAERRITKRLELLVNEIEQWQRERPDEQLPVWWLFERERLQSLQKQIEQELARFSERATTRIEEEQRRLVERAEWDAETLARVGLGEPPPGVTVTWARLPESALEQMVGHLQDGSPLRELLDALGPAASETICRELISGLALGQNPRDVAHRIRDALDGNRKRAELIARTEMLRAYREATRQSYQANGDVVKGWVWHAARDDRTCFPAGTRIRTRRGQVPIESVRPGDEVLTHSGAYCRVTEVIRRHYVGLLVEICADGSKVMATSDHPFLIERQGKLNWVEASRLRLGDTVFRDCQCRAYVRDHVLREATIKRCGGQAQYTVSARLDKKVLLAVAGANLPVPIWLIDFQRNAQIGQQKVNSIAANLEFLDESDPKLLQAKSGVALGFGFSGEAPIAAEGAEASPIGRARYDAKLFAAGKASNGDRWSAADFRTVAAIFAGMNIENLSTPFAGRINHFWMRALCGTIGIAVSVATAYRELFAATRAQLGDSTPRLVALSRAIDAACACGMKLLATFRASALSSWLRWRASWLAAMWKQLLIGRIAFTRAKSSVALTNPSGGNIKGFGTLLTDAFHAHIIQDVRWHVQSCDVYNLEVEREHSYIANGFVVHNCPMCWAMHGTEHTLDEHLDDHPRGRCAMVPLTKTWKELGFEGVPETRVEVEPGELLFAKLPEEQQRAILGNAGYEAYKAGVVTLADFVGQTSDPRWGTMRYARSLKEMLGASEAKAWYVRNAGA